MWNEGLASLSADCKIIIPSIVFKFSHSILDWTALSWIIFLIFWNSFKGVCWPCHLQELHSESELIILFTVVWPHRGKRNETCKQSSLFVSLVSSLFCSSVDSAYLTADSSVLRYPSASCALSFLLHSLAAPSVGGLSPLVSCALYSLPDRFCVTGEADGNFSYANRHISCIVL